MFKIRKGKAAVQTFLDRILINWLASYKADYLDDMVLRGIIGRFEDSPYHAEWIKVVTTANKEYTNNSGKQDFAPPREFLTGDDICQMIELAKKNCPNHEFTSGAEVMGEVLDLTLAEKKMLDFAIHLENCPYSYREVFDNFRFNESNKHTDYLYSLLLDVREDEIKKAREGFLFSSGLLNFGETIKTYPQLHTDMSDTLTQEDLTIEKLVAELFPSSMETSLGIENYAHLSEEISLCEAVINNALETNSKGTNVMFWGLAGSGKSELALVLAKKNNWRLIVVGDYGEGKGDVEKSRAQRLTSLKVALKLYAMDNRAVILFDEMEDLSKIDLNATFSKAYINRVLENAACPIIWTTNEIESHGQPTLRRMSANIAFENLPEDAAAATWKHYRGEYGAEISDEQIAEFASDFKISPALIANSVKIAKASGAQGESLTKVITSLERLVNYGAKRKPEVKPRDDIPYDISFINTKTDIARLTERLVRVKKGFTMCLWGPSGTGKSEYARHVAKLMGKKVVYRKVSDLLGPFLGETEQNIAAAFNLARKEKKVLIIDECDTFLRDRVSAQRGYEVAITNEILTQMECADFPVFMTTNLFEQLDPAIMRRFTFKEKFDFATPEQAVAMFKAYFEAEAPVRLGNIYTLTPGDFDNVAKRAKILEIDDAEEICDMLNDETEHKYIGGGKIGF